MRMFECMGNGTNPLQVFVYHQIKEVTQVDKPQFLANDKALHASAWYKSHVIAYKWPTKQ